VIFLLGIGLAVFAIYHDSGPPADGKAAPAFAPPAQVVNTQPAEPKEQAVANPLVAPAPVANLAASAVSDSSVTGTPSGPIARQLVPSGDDNALLRPYTIQLNGSGMIDPRLRREPTQGKADFRSRRMNEKLPANGR
jgi:hypothetical protein